MLTFGLFLVAVALYLLFRLWCVAPLRSIPRGRVTDWLRIVLGLWLLAGNIAPIFVFPLLLPLGLFSAALIEKSIAVTMFVRTVPIYIGNVLARDTAPATTIEIEFPLVIAGTRYRPRLQIDCTHRKMISVDKLADVIVFERFPTLVGRDLIGQAGDATVVIGPPNGFCSPTAETQLAVGPYPQFRKGFGLGPSVFLIRGEADKTKLYELRFDGEPAAIDDLVLEQPRIVSVTQRNAAEAIPLSALWPMSRDPEMRHHVPDLAWTYLRLGVPTNGCVELAYAQMDFKSQTMTTRRWRMTELRDVPAAERPAYCRRELGLKIRKPAANPIPPAAG